MRTDEHAWRITFLDGTTVTVFGSISVNEGVLWISKRGPYGGRVEGQYAYPLSALKQWERA